MPARCRYRLVALVLVVAVVGPACSGGDGGAGAGRAPVTVASFNFPESVLLGEIYAQALEAGGFPVERRLDLAAREIVEPALEQGVVDLVPEYLGSALAFLSDEGEVSADAEQVHARLETAFGERGVEVLAYAPAQNQNGVVVTRATAERLGLRTVSDLVPVAGQLTFGGPPECPQRPFCLLGLQEIYGLSFRGFQPLDSGGRLTLAALQAGEIDVALLFTTDGALAGGDLVLLEDDLGLQPAENVVPVVGEETADRYGLPATARLDAVSAQLTTDDLAGLNRRLDADERPADVAASWLTRAGLE